LKSVIERLCNHGPEREGDVEDAGTNGKMTEFQALMGMHMLTHFAGVRARAAANSTGLSGMPSRCAGHFRAGEIAAEHRMPAALSCPSFVDRDAFGMSRDALLTALSRLNVFTRRYFYRSSAI